MSVQYALLLLTAVSIAAAQSTSTGNSACDASLVNVASAFQGCGITFTETGPVFSGSQADAVNCICQSGPQATLAGAIQTCATTQAAAYTVAGIKKISAACQAGLSTGGSSSSSTATTTGTGSTGSSGIPSTGNAACDSSINTGVVAFNQCGIQFSSTVSTLSAEQVACVCQQSTLSAVNGVISSCASVQAAQSAIPSLQSLITSCQAGAGSGGVVTTAAPTSPTGTFTGNPTCDSSITLGLAAWSSCGVQISSTGTTFNGSASQVACICSAANISPIQAIITNCATVSGAASAISGLQQVVSACAAGNNAGLSSGLSGISLGGQAGSSGISNTAAGGVTTGASGASGPAATGAKSNGTTGLPATSSGAGTVAQISKTGAAMAAVPVRVALASTMIAVFLLF